MEGCVNYWLWKVDKLLFESPHICVKIHKASHDFDYMLIGCLVYSLNKYLLFLHRKR